MVVCDYDSQGLHFAPQCLSSRIVESAQVSTGVFPKLNTCLCRCYRIGIIFAVYPSFGYIQKWLDRCILLSDSRCSQHNKGANSDDTQGRVVSMDRSSLNQVYLCVRCPYRLLMAVPGQGSMRV